NVPGPCRGGADRVDDSPCKIEGEASARGQGVHHALARRVPGREQLTGDDDPITGPKFPGIGRGKDGVDDQLPHHRYCLPQRLPSLNTFPPDTLLPPATLLSTDPLPSIRGSTGRAGRTLRR